MVTCPEHPGVLLEKVQGQRIRGVWYPDFICPVDGKRFTYVDIVMHQKKVSREEAEKIVYQQAESLGYGPGGEEMMKAVERIVSEVAARIFSPEELIIAVRELLRNPATREEFKKIIREALS
jgi:hypothetical protein